VHLELKVDGLAFSLLTLAQPCCYPLGPVGGALFSDLLLVSRQLVALYDHASVAHPTDN